jgi:hypothetical protein
MIQDNKDIEFTVKDKNRSKFYLNGTIFDYANKVLKEQKVFDPIASTKLNCQCVGFFYLRELYGNVLDIISCPLLKNMYNYNEVDHTYSICATIHPGYPLDILGEENKLSDSFIPTIEFREIIDTIDTKGSTLEQALHLHNISQNAKAECFYVAYREFNNDSVIIENFVPNSILLMDK